MTLRYPDTDDRRGLTRTEELRLQLADEIVRGVLAPGMRADLNLIDFDRLSFGPARMAYDLPAGARRLVQKAQGYVGTWCGGVQTVADDEFTGELPGRLLRAGH